MNITKRWIVWRNTYRRWRLMWLLNCFGWHLMTASFAGASHYCGRFVFVFDHASLDTIANTIRVRFALRSLRLWLPSRWFLIYPRTLSVQFPNPHSYAPHPVDVWHLVIHRWYDNQTNLNQDQLLVCTDSKLHCNVNHVDIANVMVRHLLWFVPNQKCWPVLIHKIEKQSKKKIKIGSEVL